MADQACTTADVKAQLGISDATDDSYISGLIDAVTDFIQSPAGAGRIVVPKTGQSFLVDTAGGSVIDVRRYGIRTITTLGIATSNQPDSGGSYTTVSAADIVLRPPELDRDPGMPATAVALLGSSGRLAYAINGASFTGCAIGPATTPERVKRVAIDAVVAAYQDRRAGGSGVIGADATAGVPWSTYFAAGSPQAMILDSLRGIRGIA